MDLYGKQCKHDWMANVNVSGNVPVRFHPSVAVFSGFGSSIGTISPLESKLAMFQCKEDKKI